MVLYVLVLLYTNNEILLLRRSETQPFGAGLYSLVGGKVEADEPALHAIARETFEETGLHLPEDAFSLKHVLHRKGTEGPFIAFCFTADITHMQPQNKEPEKHDAMNMFRLDALPANILPAHKQIIDNIIKNSYYSEHGWE